MYPPVALTGVNDVAVTPFIKVTFSLSTLVVNIGGTIVNEKFLLLVCSA